MNRSDTIGHLALALAKAQGEITGALKESKNPFYKSSYADLASCWDACRSSLAANELAVVQTTQRGEPVKIEWEVEDSQTGEVKKYGIDSHEIVIVTTLLHSSGEWISSPLPLVPRDITPQGIGTAISYGRRYGLTAMVGIAQIDDDGNAQSGRNNAYAQSHSPKGELGKNINQDQAREVATAMRGILEADYDEHLRALKVLDKHEIINRDPDLYVAASNEMSAKERSAWKQYVKLAKEAQNRPLANARA